ncbi:hypothetical protein C8J57DRAFT_182988 [Mycena rebaudengoi]|nr:hypothetical protein C8J57DRAFT_182988 [Mycena rebaudengoi]
MSWLFSPRCRMHRPSLRRYPRSLPCSCDSADYMRVFCVSPAALLRITGDLPASARAIPRHRPHRAVRRWSRQEYRPTLLARIWCYRVEEKAWMILLRPPPLFHLFQIYDFNPWHSFSVLRRRRIARGMHMYCRASPSACAYLSCTEFAYCSSTTPLFARALAILRSSHTPPSPALTSPRALTTPCPALTRSAFVRTYSITG